MKLFLIAALLAICVANSYHMELNDIAGQKEIQPVQNSNTGQHAPHRTKRGFWDIFSKVSITKNLLVDQFVDTRDTFNEIYNLFNSQFSDPNPPKPTYRPGITPAPKSSDEDSSETGKTTTTKKPYRISQYELGQIIGRNLRGLNRLAVLEFRDSLNATQYNLQQYRAEANKQFGNSLVSEKKKRIYGIRKG